MDLKKSTAEKTDIEMLQSIRLFSPGGKAPDYAIADMVIEVDKLEKEIAKMKEFSASDGKTRLQVRRSKAGNIYSVYNEYYKGREVKSKDHSPDRDDLPY
jgi:hypothetical protein|tara:strand:- start:211 stop:510 length:300 start_codon:yes stop_codon:yes gene_type:complete